MFATVWKSSEIKFSYFKCRNYDLLCFVNKSDRVELIELQHFLTAFARF